MTRGEMRATTKALQLNQPQAPRSSPLKKLALLGEASRFCGLKKRRIRRKELRRRPDNFSVPAFWQGITVGHRPNGRRTAGGRCPGSGSGDPRVSR
eukprot:CAMPEP_0172608970 /NCGR_PEP_ID=MMETSP1068-20121228/29007_1 /TAXON_ID=35684 /ORGANISM="Pseudopedinella elastica, Strain CCMP716" /LENGTH=95 /DNA_ID=CAMNT_0013412383 /DNA_START=315 /DNA_END=601 /DNA_ORIENTATION=-